MEGYVLPPLSLNGDRNAKQKEQLQPQQEYHQSLSTTAPSVQNKRPSPFPPPTYPPPAYTQDFDVPPIPFPDVPSTALAPLQLRSTQNVRTPNSLPSLASLTGSTSSSYVSPRPREPAYSQSPPPTGNDPWPSLNPFTAYYAPSHAQTVESPGRMDVDTGAIGAMSAASPGRQLEGRAGSVNLDDPDVRMAAEALGDLRADFVSSPPTRTTSRPAASSPDRSDSLQSSEPEPLFALLTTSHPFLATTIEGATSVYTNSKNFSPRFKSGAEYVEGYLTPIANTVGSVSRVTGVEGGVRWFLGAGRRPHSSGNDLEAAHGGSNKRRKVDGSGSDRGGAGGMDLQTSAGHLPTTTTTTTTTTTNNNNSSNDPYAFTKERRSSMSTVDTLPIYDEIRSPAYEVTDRQGSSRTPTGGRTASGPSSSSAWQSRLIMSTSGLSIAMSDESLRSLKYCLRWLRWANDHIAGVVDTLKTTLDKYDGKSPDGQAESSGVATAEQASPDQAMSDAGPSTAAAAEFPQASATELAGRIAAMRNDVLKTLRDVVDTVSKYAGGALPENARVLVRKHLTSLPQRFRLASQAEAGAEAGGHAQHPSASDESEKGLLEREKEEEKEMRDGAQRVLVLAKEGLDMMAQVSGVLDGTIVSAEEWCERLGRKRREERDGLLGGGDGSGGDVGSAPPATPPTPTIEGMPSVGADGDVKMG